MMDIGEEEAIIEEHYSMEAMGSNITNAALPRATENIYTSVTEFDVKPL